MKNKGQFTAALAFMLAVSLGCGLFGRSEKTASEPESGNSNKTLTDKAVDKTVGETKIGVPECDEVMDAITEELNNSDENFVAKAIKAIFLNRIKDSIRKSVEENKSDIVEMAKTCREFKTQFEKYKAEEKAKQNK